MEHVSLLQRCVLRACALSSSVDRAHACKMRCHGSRDTGVSHWPWLLSLPGHSGSVQGCSGYHASALSSSDVIHTYRRLQHGTLCWPVPFAAMMVAASPWIPPSAYSDPSVTEPASQPLNKTSASLLKRHCGLLQSQFTIPHLSS